MVTQGARAWDGTGTAEDPYLIESEFDWVYVFVAKINNPDSYPSFCDKYYKLTADITVSYMVGMGVTNQSTAENMRAFKGTFDGNNHTITLNLNVTKYDSDTPTAPFAALDGATIKNLNVAGSITTDGE